MRFCTSCGTPLENNALFCFQCGAKVIPSSVPAVPETKEDPETDAPEKETAETLPETDVPAEPEQPEEPETPAEPKEPEEPAEPEEPEEPNEPEEPVEPEEPEEPNEPEEPEKPEEPKEPEEPAELGESAEPEKPSEPKEPEEPEKPAEFPAYAPPAEPEAPPRPAPPPLPKPVQPPKPVPPKPAQPPRPVQLQKAAQSSPAPEPGPQPEPAWPRQEPAYNGSSNPPYPAYGNQQYAPQQPPEYDSPYAPPRENGGPYAPPPPAYGNSYAPLPEYDSPYAPPRQNQGGRYASPRQNDDPYRRPADQRGRVNTPPPRKPRQKHKGILKFLSFLFALGLLAVSAGLGSMIYFNRYAEQSLNTYLNDEGITERITFRNKKQFADALAAAMKKDMPEVLKAQRKFISLYADTADIDEMTSEELKPYRDINNEMLKEAEKKYGFRWTILKVSLYSNLILIIGGAVCGVTLILWLILGGSFFKFSKTTLAPLLTMFIIWAICLVLVGYLLQAPNCFDIGVTYTLPQAAPVQPDYGEFTWN